MTPRLNVGKGVSGATRYVLGQGRDPKTGEVIHAAAGDASRVDWISGQNFGFRIASAEDAELARRIMEFDALNQRSRTRQCENDCVHLALSWKPGENPSRHEMEAAAQEALKALGMENAKAIFVAHNDEDYTHVHIIASKINPATGRAYDLAGSYRTLSRWAQDYELAHGGILSPTRQGANELRDAIAARDPDAILSALTKQRATFTNSQLHRVLEKELIGPARGAARLAAEKELVRFEAEVLGRTQVVELVDDQKHGRGEQGERPARRFTTQAVLIAEQQVIAAVKDLAENLNHGVSERTQKQVAAAAQMTAEQARAFTHATRAGGFAVIDGQAGTGKSYTLAAIRAAYEASGYDATGLAPTNAVAQDMGADGFKHAATIHSEIFALNNGKRAWNTRTVVIVDEAAMIDTKLMAMVTSHAAAAGAKLILVGDDRQLSSIDHGGMFAVLKDKHGGAQLTEVKRQHKNDERRASEMFASGNFHDALNIYEGKGAIHWTRTQREARAELIDQWTQDSAAAPEKTRFVFAYTNSAVDELNAALRDVRRQRGELGEDHQLATATGRRAFAAGDRIQFGATDKKLGIVNGAAGTVESIAGKSVTVMLDGRQPKRITFHAATFDAFRHGYAGTIYKGQGRTLDQVFLYHSEHWRSASSYVAMTRHRDKAALFVARNTAKDVKELARQMGRTDDRRAASMFDLKRGQTQQQAPGEEAPRRLAPAELLAVLAPKGEGREAHQPDNTPEHPQLRDLLAKLAAAEPAHRDVRQARHYADMDASHRAAEPTKPADRTDAPEIARVFAAAADHMTARVAGNFDRDAANAAWQSKVDAAGVAQGGKPDPHGDPHKAPSAEPRETILEDYYPPAEPTEAVQARRSVAGASIPGEASTGSAAPESDRSAGFWSGFAKVAETLGRMLFGRVEGETTAVPPAESVERRARAAEAGDAVEVRAAERMAELLRVTEHDDAEATQTEEHDESRKRGLSR